MARKRIEKNLAYDDDKKLYYAYFNYGNSKDGTRIRKTRTFYEEEEARLSLLEFETKRLRGRLITPSRMTLEQWLDYWLDDIIQPNRAQTTYYCYRSIVKNHIVPALGTILLQALTPQRIQQYYTQTMRTKGLSSNSVYKHHILLHTALKLAYRQEILSDNPVDRVEPPKELPAHQLYYTPLQLRELFQKVEGTWLELVVKLGGYLGLRRGEICGLRWDCVDFERNVIYIRATRTTAGNLIVEKGPKSDSSERTLGIGDLEDLISLLYKVQRQQDADRREKGEKYKDSGYVLTRRDGTPRHPNQVTCALGQFVRQHNLPPITIHGLRHTFASVANQANVPLLDIGKALGHKDVSITGRIYAHIFDKTHQDVLNKVALCIHSDS